MVIRGNAYSRGLVLVIEGDEGMRQAIDNLLDAAGFSAIAYSTAKELVADRRVDGALCVIGNVKLPGTRAFELLTEWRTRSGHPPMILISATDTVAMRNKAKRYGAAAYLAKPFAASELLAAIEHIAEESGQKRMRISK